mmetsp:Transcript_16371/g.34205  ORF Transcript_16371/g.34205 Transcript_16371/m.34205 type:complete len:116 (-) Transcript_16371:55-402(-)
MTCAWMCGSRTRRNVRCAAICLLQPVGDAVEVMSDIESQGNRDSNYSHGRPLYLIYTCPHTPLESMQSFQWHVLSEGPLQRIVFAKKCLMDSSSTSLSDRGAWLLTVFRKIFFHV